MAQKAPSILLVDDDLDICQNLSDILNDLDFTVDVATDGVAAISLIERKHYDLALLDLKMPGMNGLALYREIKRRSAGTLAMLITGHADSDTVDEAMREGIVQVLSKPVKVPRLFEAVNEALGRPLVMVVDDDLELCDNLRDLLRDQGFRVFVAHDQEEAARQLQDRTFQVVLIDMKLPQGDGGGVFRVVHETNPGARTVLITGHRPEMARIVSGVVEEGADAVCYKPFDVETLIETIHRLASAREGAARGA